jgi:hypothetical protein
MKPDLALAQRIGESLIEYKDSHARKLAVVLDIPKLQTILNAASPDPLAAEQELVMALRHYTQEREQQIGCGEFRPYSSEEESFAARWFTLSKRIVFDRANPKGVEFVKRQIATTIEGDISTDTIKWQAVISKEERLLIEFTTQYNPNQPLALDTEEDTKKRKQFAEGTLRWHKGNAEHLFRKYYGSRLEIAMRKMLEEHRDYWAQRPAEAYDDSKLNHVFEFSIYGGNYGLGCLFGAWDMYLEERISGTPPFGRCTEEERAADKDERRRRPIAWPHSHPNARDIIESHIRKFIREDIIADIPKWERYANELEDEKNRRQERRIARIQELRDEFVSKVRSLYGQQVLEMISNEDLDHYSLGIVDRRERASDLWYSILKKHQFDGLTKSCVYFIRQGSAIKIGITDDLDRRFAQIKTSAASSCIIENVIYTHHGRKLERELHRALVRYNTHLEWFVLPQKIENILFAAKCIEDVENFLQMLARGEFNDSSSEMTGGLAIC